MPGPVAGRLGYCDRAAGRVAVGGQFLSGCGFPPALASMPDQRERAWPPVVLPLGRLGAALGKRHASGTAGLRLRSRAGATAAPPAARRLPLAKAPEAPVSLSRRITRSCRKMRRLEAGVPIANVDATLQREKDLFVQRH